jgi:hypothetical protein
VAVPADHEYMALRLNERATNWGIRFVGLFGAGQYQISDVFTIQSINAAGSQTNFVKRNRSSWLVQSSGPALFSIAARPVFELRLRERLEHNGGRVFSGRSTSGADQQLFAQLFTRLLPAITTNLEAEVVVRWPAVEFFVEKP